MFINNKHQSNTKNLRIFNRIFHDIPRLRFFIWLGRRKFRWQFRWKIEKHRQKTCGNEMPWGDGWPIFWAMMPWPPLNRHDAMMLWLLWKMDEHVYSNVIYPIITYKKIYRFSPWLYFFSLKIFRAIQGPKLRCQVLNPTCQGDDTEATSEW